MTCCRLQLSANPQNVSLGPRSTARKNTHMICHPYFSFTLFYVFNKSLAYNHHELENEHSLTDLPRVCVSMLDCATEF